MHPRVALHQVAFLSESMTAFIDHVRALGVQHVTLVSPKLMAPGGLEEAQAALVPGGVGVETVNHPFALFPDLERDEGRAAEDLMQAIAIAATLEAKAIYLLTGGRGGLDWEGAAARFSTLVEPCRAEAERRGIRLLVENASALNADIHIAHTLGDTIRLADQAGMGLCIDLHGCWAEAGLGELFARAMPKTALVQVSDYVLGDRSTPCRAVPGDGTIPLERLIGQVLAAGYAGVFDLELVGPRIVEEGHRAATARGAEHLSAILERLGA